jgi:hypothetical protein
VRHGMCELTARHGRGTAWARHGQGVLYVNRPSVVVVSIYRPDMPHLKQTLPDIEINNLYVFSCFPNICDGHDNVRDVTCSDTGLVEGQRNLVNRGNIFPETTSDRPTGSSV